MSKGNESGLLTTGDAVVDWVLAGLNASGLSQTERFRALARVLMWTSLVQVSGESAEMATARELLHNGALMFERAARLEVGASAVSHDAGEVGDEAAA